MGPGMHTFWDMYTSVIDKINIEETNTVWAKSLPKGRGMHCHGRTSRWAPPIISVMNGRQVEHLWTRVGLQVAESMHFRSPNIIWPSSPSLIIHYGRQWPEMLTRPKTLNIQNIHTLSVTEADSQPNIVSHYGQVYRSQEVCVSGPMFIRLFFSCFGGYYHISKYSTITP